MKKKIPVELMIFLFWTVIIGLLIVLKVVFF